MQHQRVSFSAKKNTQGQNTEATENDFKVALTQSETDDAP